jgi:signal transduction histidine kinase
MSALLAAILLAAALTVWLAGMVRHEQRMVAAMIRGDAAAGGLASSLPTELRWQFGLALVVLVTLLATAVAFIAIWRRYLASRHSLRQVKVLAGDILASMDQAVLTTNCAGVVTSINRCGQDLLAVDFDCVGQRLERISRPEIALDALSREVLARLRPIGDREFLLSQDGHLRRLRADCHLLRDTDGGVLGTVLHVRDVTERVLMEERSRRMERHLGLGSLAAGLHHEIKNPLTALSLHVQLLDERLAEQPLSSEAAEMLGVIKTEVTRLNGVLDSFRDFAAMRGVAVQPTQIADLVAKAVRLVRPQAERQRVAVRVSLPETALEPVPVDPRKFEQMLLNLIINGLEAMPGGGELTIGVMRRNGQLCVEVSDTGHGIPPAVQSRVFDAYFTTKSDGAGMGLAWCEKIVQMHHGHIDFSTGPAGTKFTVTMPCANDVG